MDSNTVTELKELIKTAQRIQRINDIDFGLGAEEWLVKTQLCIEEIKNVRQRLSN